MIEVFYDTITSENSKSKSQGTEVHCCKHDLKKSNVF